MISNDLELKNCFVEKSTDFVRERVLTSLLSDKKEAKLMAS
jgi:hypothetical protein